MSQNLSHPIKVESVSLLYFARERADKQVQVHKSGCAHQHKADEVDAAEPAVEFVDSVLADDWFFVANCARKAPLT